MTREEATEAVASGRGAWWDKGHMLMLIRPEELNQLPKGTRLKCIDDRVVEVGKDEIDTDTRFGFLAFGYDVEK